MTDSERKPPTKAQLVYIFAGFAAITIGLVAADHHDWLGVYGMFLSAVILFAAGFGGLKIVRKP